MDRRCVILTLSLSHIIDRSIYSYLSLNNDNIYAYLLLWIQRGWRIISLNFWSKWLAFDTNKIQCEKIVCLRNQFNAFNGVTNTFSPWNGIIFERISLRIISRTFIYLFYATKSEPFSLWSGEHREWDKHSFRMKKQRNSLMYSTSTHTS